MAVLNTHSLSFSGHALDRRCWIWSQKKRAKEEEGREGGDKKRRIESIPASNTHAASEGTLFFLFAKVWAFPKGTRQCSLTRNRSLSHAEITQPLKHAKR